MDITNSPEQAAEVKQELDQYRGRIDTLDDQILELLNQRAQVALKIAQGKQNGSLAIFAPAREALLMRRLLESNRGPLPDRAVRQVFHEIVSACRSLQGPIRVAFLGPEFSYSHQAARGRFGGGSKLAAQATIHDVFEEVERGHSSIGVVPVENSSEGGVGAAMDQLMRSQLKVCGEIFLPINHMLMSASPSLEGIEVVCSHPQALAQTRAWLRRNLPWARLEETSSTSAAAELASVNPKVAAVGSEMSATHWELPVLARGIQDSPHNVTRFFIICKDYCPPTGSDKTSILFMVAHRPDSLYLALGKLAGRGINLTRIESRPTKDRPWEYAFFVDLSGHLEDPSVAEALEALAGEVQYCRVLGSYPDGNPNEQGQTPAGQGDRCHG